MTDATRNDEIVEAWRARTGRPVPLDKARPATMGIVTAAVEAIGEAVGAELKQLRADIAALKTQLAEIEARGIHYEGIFQRAQQYKRGAMVTSHGSLFAAIRNVEPGECPGDSSGAWQLCAKKGRDSRDGRER